MILPTYIAIVANGEINDYPAAAAKLSAAGTIIACDGGLRHCPPLGIIPDYILGDFDSAPPKLLEQYRRAGVPALSFPSEKDETDLELAVAHALALDADTIILIGASGGRADHQLANIHVLAQSGNIPMEMWDERTSIRLVRDKIILPREEYKTVSLIPLTTEVTGITTQGLKYALNNEVLRIGQTRGVSNEFAADIADVVVGDGMLLVVCNV